MRLRPQLVVIAVPFLCTLVPFALAEKVADIKPTGYVIDLANVIHARNAQAKITAMATELQQKTETQIAVVTVNSLEGDTKEQYAVDLYKHLGVGPKKTEEGVVLLVAPKERQGPQDRSRLRARARHQRRQGRRHWPRHGPGLRPGDYSAAILGAMTQIAQYVAASKGVQITAFPIGSQRGQQAWKQRPMVADIPRHLHRVSDYSRHQSPRRRRRSRDRTA